MRIAPSCKEILYKSNLSSVMDNPRCYLDKDHKGRHEAYDRILGKVSWGIVDNSILIKKVYKPLPGTLRQWLRLLFKQCKICDRRFCSVWAVYKDQKTTNSVFLLHRW